MKFNWMSNAPFANTGYGNQTRTFVPRLQAAGHEASVTAFYGLEGAILNWGGIQIYPKGRDVWGNDIAAAHTTHFGAKILITLMDAWVCEPDMLQLHGVRWVPWFPVDMEPLPPAVARKVKKAYRRIAFSKFGERMVNDAGMDCYYVPHGIDTNVYKPIDREEARERLGLPADAFIVGTVSANKGTPSRKSLPEQIEAFALFKKKHSDAVFVVHSLKAEHGENQGVNLPEVCEYHGLTVDKDVIFPDPYQLLIGYSDAYMNALYNAFDVFLLPSMGEGFGIPIIEAQAAGCPVIVGDWTSMSELCLSGLAIPKEDAQPWWTPLGAYQFKPDVMAIVDHLEQAYQKITPNWRKVAAKEARKYDADRITKKYWLPVLSEIEEAVGQWQR